MFGLMFGFTPKPVTKEPPAISAEKFMDAIKTGNLQSATDMLDPAVRLKTPMVFCMTKANAKAWLHFEFDKVLAPYRDKIVWDSQVGASSEGEKSASVTWRIGALKFTDTIVLNQMLLIKSIDRALLRRAPKNADEEAITRALLEAWTGPHFSSLLQTMRPTSRGLSPQKHASSPPQGNGRSVSTRSIQMPVLDFSYCGLQRCIEMHAVEPRDGKRLNDDAVALHYLESSVSTVTAPPPQPVAVVTSAADDHVAQARKAKKDEVTIRAKNRQGEQAALVIDRNALITGTISDARMLGEDDAIAMSQTAVRYVASGLRLCNNDLTTSKDLPDAILRHCFHAFFFLTWVDLSSNKLIDIPDLASFPIIVFYLHDNKLRDIGEVAKLSKLPLLQSVTLFGNPLQCEVQNTMRDYKFKALKLIAGERHGASLSLKSFDHAVLSPQDRGNIDRFSVMFPNSTPSTGDASRPGSRSSSRPRSRQ